MPDNSTRWLFFGLNFSNRRACRGIRFIPPSMPLNPRTMAHSFWRGLKSWNIISSVTMICLWRRLALKHCTCRIWHWHTNVRWCPLMISNINSSFFSCWGTTSSSIWKLKFLSWLVHGFWHNFFWTKNSSRITYKIASDITCTRGKR